MKNINLEILTKLDSLVKLYKDRDTLVRMSIKFGGNPEGTILKLTDLDVLSSDDQDKFVMYNKALVGVNTKDSSISLAQKELFKIIDTINSDIVTVVGELETLNPIINVVDNTKALMEYLDDAGATNLLNVLNKDKAMAEYGAHKIYSAMSTLGSPCGDELECVNISKSIASTMLNIRHGIDTDVVAKYNKSIVVNAHSIKLDSKQIEETIDSDIKVVNKEELLEVVHKIDLSISSEKLIDYIMMQKYDNNVSIINAFGTFYNDIKQNELTLSDLADRLSITNYSNLISVNKTIDGVIKRYSKDELTDKEMFKLYSEYDALFVKEFNNVITVIKSAVSNSNELNRLTYVLYLSKALAEKILIEATIK